VAATDTGEKRAALAGLWLAMQRCRSSGMTHEDVTRALVTCLMQAYPIVQAHPAEPGSTAYGPDEKTQPTGLKPPRRNEK
jgi:hypothetical protein